MLKHSQSCWYFNLFRSCMRLWSHTSFTAVSFNHQWRPKAEHYSVCVCVCVCVCVSACLVAHVACFKCSLKDCCVASFSSSLSSNDQTASNIIRACSMSQSIGTFAPGNLTSFSCTIKQTVSQCVSPLSLKSPQPGSKTDILLHWQ